MLAHFFRSLFPAPVLPPARPARTVSELLPEYYEQRVRRGCREVTLANDRAFMREAVQILGPLPIDSLTTDDYKRLLRTKSEDFTKRLSTFVRWAWRHEYLATNITFPREPGQLRDATPPRHLSPTEAQRYFPAMLPAFRPALALGMFAGLRPFEICRMDWKWVNLGDRKIHIPAHVAKTRRERWIEGDDLPTILWAQLQWGWKREGPFIPGRTLRGRVVTWNLITSKTAQRCWVTLAPDVFRHSFATYFTALTGNPGRTAKILGHIDLAVLERNYDGKREHCDALEYFHPKPILALKDRVA